MINISLQNKFNRKQYYSKTITIALSSIFLIMTPAKAQLIPDNTLGAESSRVIPVSTNRDDIRGGATRGANLFQSFQEFNVAPGRSVYFANPTGIKNILTRVTGGNISNIFGRLGVDGGANLYLINPNGIFFGDGAKLDIRSSFVGTTADGIKLGNTGSFSAINPNSDNLLSVMPGVLFTNQIRTNPRIIINQANLELRPGANLTFSADAIDNNGAILAPGGNVFLESIKGDINIRNIDTSDNISGGGDIAISATGVIAVNGKIEASGGEFILDQFGLPVSQSEQITNAGNLTLVARNGITFNSNSSLFANGTFAGEINIQTFGNLTANNSLITSISSGTIQGKGRGIRVLAKAIELNNSFFGSITNGIVNAGNISIDTESLNIINGGLIGTLTLADGNGGNLTIKANSIDLIGNLNGFPSSLLVQSGGQGNAGNINLTTDSLRILSGGQIATSTFAEGDAGNLTIFARVIELIGSDSVNDLSSGLFTRTRGDGKAGDLRITTDSLRLLDGGLISTSSFSSMSNQAENIRRNLPESIGGNLTIFARKIDLIGTDVKGLPSAIVSQAFRRANAGDINIITDYLGVLDGARISTLTRDQGDGGNLTIFAKEIDLIGTDVNGLPSGLFSGAIDSSKNRVGIGNGGNIDIHTKQLKILDGAVINSSNFIINLDLPGIDRTLPGLGRTGNINIKTEKTFLDRGQISANGNRQEGGEITIDSSKFIILRNQSEISTNVGETIGFSGGNLNINTPLIIALPTDNKITARAITTQGGIININAKAIFGYPQNLNIDASSQLGIDGNINITGLTNEFERDNFKSNLVPIEPTDLPKLDKCPFDFKEPDLSSNVLIPATVGFCRNNEGRIFAY